HQAGERASVVSASDVGGEFRLDSARRLEHALQDVLAGALLANRRQLRPDRAAAIADLVAASAVHGRRPEERFAARGVALKRQDAARPGAGAELTVGCIGWQ